MDRYQVIDSLKELCKTLQTIPLDDLNVYVTKYSADIGRYETIAGAMLESIDQNSLKAAQQWHDAIRMLLKLRILIDKRKIE